MADQTLILVARIRARDNLRVEVSDTTPVWEVLAKISNALEAAGIPSGVIAEPILPNPNPALGALWNLRNAVAGKMPPDRGYILAQLDIAMGLMRR